MSGKQGVKRRNAPAAAKRGAVSGASSDQPPSPPASQAAVGWTFLTNHTHVLLCLAADPEMRLRDVAARVGVTERAVQKIVAELVEGGVITRTRDGRRNHYVIDASQHLRHPIERHCTIAVLLDILKR